MTQSERELRRQLDLANRVIVELKTLLTRRTNTLRIRAERAEAEIADRCPSCDHKRVSHDADGRCWYIVENGTPGSNLVCPCAPRKDEG